MINEIKIMLGDSAMNFSDDLIALYYKQSLNEIEDYCGREADTLLEGIADRITVIKLNRINSEGLASQAYSGVSESYIDGYPADIQAILDRKRKIKVL